MLIIKSNLKSSIFWVMAIFVAILQSRSFYYGYRTTADDIEGHYYLLKGVGSLISYAESTAEYSGRIGHLILIPVGAIASYLSGFIVFRVFSVLIYFLILLLAAKYVSIVLRRNVTLLTWVLMISLVPLDWLHFPPNAFPQFLWPIIAIFVSRLLLWQLYVLKIEKLILIQSIVFLVQMFAMLATEYGIILFVALASIDLLTRVKRHSIGVNDGRFAIKYELKHISFVIDVTLLIITLCIYAMYRYNYPSQYAGVSPGGIFNLVDVMRTTIGHIYAGLSLARLESFEIITSRFLSLGYVALFLAIITGVLSAMITWYSLVLSVGKSLPWRSVIFALGFAVFVTLPLAVSIQYQNWCHGWFAVSCGYLDSRISYIGIVVALALLILKITSLSSGKVKFFCLRLLSASVVGLAASFTYINNTVAAIAMENRSQAWKRADVLTCKPEFLNTMKQNLHELIDNNNLISYHPGFPVSDYWNAYMLDRIKYLNCPNVLNSHAQIVEEIRFDANLFFKVGESVSFKDFKNRKYLKSGWSHSENDGVWSDSETSIVLGYLEGTRHVDLDLIVSGQPFLSSFHDTQRVDLYVNQHQIGSLLLSIENIEQTHKLRIPLDLISSNSGMFEIVFKFNSLKSPMELGVSSDPRRLGFKLRTISLVEAK